MLSKVLITGGAGFIGSHLAERLVKSGASSVVVLDSLEFGRWSNLGPVEAQVEKVTADLSDLTFEEMKHHLKGVEVLFHLAAQKHTHRVDSAQRVLAANVMATERLFRAAAAAGVRRVVFASSLFAYGRMVGSPMTESEVAIPNTIYGVSKLTGEGLLRSVMCDTGLEGVTLRLFFIYGPRQYVGLGYPSVIIRTFERISQGLCPTIYGDGKQSLDYVYIDDAIDAFLKAADTPHLGEVFNVARGVNVQVDELIATASELAGWAGPPEYGPADFTAGTCRVGETSKTRELLSWEAQVSLREGLEKTHRWMMDVAVG